MTLSNEQRRAAGLRLTNILGLVQQVLIPTLTQIAEHPEMPELERKVTAEVVFDLLGVVKRGVAQLTVVPDGAAKDLTSNRAVVLRKLLDEKVQGSSVQIARQLRNLSRPVIEFEDTKVDLSDDQKQQSEEIISLVEQRLKAEVEGLQT
jgi:hypothetical protein